MIRLITLIILAAAFAAPAAAKPPRPDCGKSHCKISWVSYSYIEHGHGSDGNPYVRTCYVPAHGQRHCSAWILERRAYLR